MSSVVDKVIKEARPKMEGGQNNYEAELAGLRVGRATAALVESVMVDAYGSSVMLKTIAYITVPDPMSLLVAPYDKGMLKPIEDALSRADLGTMPVNIGTGIRVNFPPLTEQRREEVIKVAKIKAEETKVQYRLIRQAAWEQIQKLEKDKLISEDDKYYGQEHLNRLVDEFNKKIEEILYKKEQEIRKI